MKVTYFFFLLVLTNVIYGQTKVSHQFLIDDITIIDVTNGNLLPHRSIGIDSGRITEIYKHEVLPSATTIAINGKGKYVIPGFWDMHVHYYWHYKTSTHLLIANGVVGVREMFGNIVEVKKIRELEKSGAYVGPEIISSGAMIDGSQPTADAEWAKDSISAVEIVDRQFKDGVDFLKIHDGALQFEVYNIIARRAKQYNLSFAGHVPLNNSVWHVIAMGQKSIEHNLGILEATADSLVPFYIKTQSNPKNGPLSLEKIWNYSIDHHNENLFDTLINKLAKSDTWLCPTMVAMEGGAYQFDDSIKNDYREKYLTNYLKECKNTINDTGLVMACRRKYLFDLSHLKKMIDGGVKFLAGTDFACVHVYPGFSIHDELYIFCKAGFTPLQALQTATINPAIFLNKLRDYGTIEKSKIASLIILNSNPLQDIRKTKDIDAVILKGNYYNKTRIEELLNRPLN